MKKAVFWIFGIVIFIILAGFLLKNINPGSEYIAETERKNVEEKAYNENALMTFEVKVPENTLEGDSVWIYLHNQKGYKMDQIDEFSHRKSFSIYDIGGLNEGGTVKYRYGRNGYDFHTAEYLEHDTNDYFWTEKGRSTKFENGKTQRDVVERWRWFPKIGLPAKTTNIEPEGVFLQRVDGIEFRSGQIIEDLYVGAFDDFFNSTAKHMNETKYKWVEIDPPLQLVINEEGLPEVINSIESNPNYPTPDKLKEEILAYKKQGLKVILAPQLCCVPINSQNRSAEWWNVYFAEVEAFLISNAKVAEETGVDAFHYAVGPDYQGNDKDARWRKIFREVRKHFSGEVGEMVWNFENYRIIPDSKYITWGDELDYFYVAVDTPISLKDNPDDDELKDGAGKMLDGTKELYMAYNKPIFIRTTYFNVKQTWKGNSFYNIGSVPWISEPERALEESIYDFGPEDQARVVNAYFRAIAERPFIIGYAQFGYTHWENPLSAELSVRGKPSEDLWRKWNEYIYD